MIRIRQIILKENIFDWVGNPKVSKVVLSRGKNHTIKNPALCVVYVFHSVDASMVNSIMGECKALITKDNEKGFLEGKEHAFLNGIQSQKHYGWLSKSMVLKLIAIEEKYDVNLSISKYIRNLIEKY